MTEVPPSVIHGECVTKLKSMESNSIDLILTDPPYGINYKDKFAKNGLDVIQNDNPEDIDWDDLLLECYRVLKPKKTIYIFCRTDMIMRIGDNLNRSKLHYCHDFIWIKGDMNYGNLNVMGTSHEMIIALSKGTPEKSRIIQVNNEDKKRTLAAYVGKLPKKENYGHPTQKPVGLLGYLILNRTDAGDLVLDPFAGSGSTLVAAKLLGRESTGIELDEKFIKLMEDRLQDETHLDMYREMFKSGMVSATGGVTYKIK
jgi:DNA modification methylase